MSILSEIDPALFLGQIFIDNQVFSMVKSNDGQFDRQQKRVVFYSEQSGRVSVLRWLENLPEQHQTKCLSLVRRLGLEDDRLQFPHTRHLSDGIHELRIRFGRIRYRIFYFWHGNVAVIAHGIVKKTSAVPPREIETARRRRSQFENNPSRHTQEVINV